MKLADPALVNPPLFTSHLDISEHSPFVEHTTPHDPSSANPSTTVLLHNHATDTSLYSRPMSTSVVPLGGGYQLHPVNPFITDPHAAGLYTEYKTAADFYPVGALQSPVVGVPQQPPHQNNMEYSVMQQQQQGGEVFHHQQAHSQQIYDVFYVYEGSDTVRCPWG